MRQVAVTEGDKVEVQHKLGWQVNTWPVGQLVDEINKVTGYIRGGCSPVGMKKRYPTVFDRRLEALPLVVVSGGRIGTQIEVEPAALLRAVDGRVAEVAVEP